MLLSLKIKFPHCVKKIQMIKHTLKNPSKKKRKKEGVCFEFSRSDFSPFFPEFSQSLLVGTGQPKEVFDVVRSPQVVGLTAKAVLCKVLSDQCLFLFF